MSRAAASKWTGRSRESTADRASVDTNASIASSGASSSHEQAKRLKKDDVDIERSGSLVSVSKDSQVTFRITPDQADCCLLDAYRQLFDTNMLAMYEYTIQS